jgi:hypothetical protein
VDGLRESRRWKLGKELVGSYTSQDRLYHWFKSNDYGRILSDNNAHTIRISGWFASRIGPSLKSYGIFAYDKWLERRGNTPREVIDRKWIKAILGFLK